METTELRNVKSVSVTTFDAEVGRKDWTLRVRELHRYDDQDPEGNMTRVEIFTYGEHWIRILGMQLRG